MDIRVTQLQLFGDPAPANAGGDQTCSLEHRKAKRAKYRVYFNNGNSRVVCGHCVKLFKPGGEHADKVRQIENLTT